MAMGQVKSYNYDMTGSRHSNTGQSGIVWRDSGRHIIGTNMADYIDTFEKLCVQMVSCSDPPTEQQKIELFMDFVNERTYNSIHAHCTDLYLEDGFTYAKLAKLYTHRCFARHPQFQI